MFPKKFFNGDFSVGVVHDHVIGGQGHVIAEDLGQGQGRGDQGQGHVIGGHHQGINGQDHVIANPEIARDLSPGHGIADLSQDPEIEGGLRHVIVSVHVPEIVDQDLTNGQDPRTEEDLGQRAANARVVAVKAENRHQNLLERTPRTVSHHQNLQLAENPRICQIRSVKLDHLSHHLIHPREMLQNHPKKKILILHKVSS